VGYGLPGVHDVIQRNRTRMLPSVMKMLAALILRRNTFYLSLHNNGNSCYSSPISSFHNTGFVAMKSFISLMHSSLFRMTSSTPLERR
jgi:hypothetical protein